MEVSQSTVSVGMNPHEVTGVLQQALSELERVKRQLKQPYATKETVAASISRLEDGLRRQAQDIAYAAATAEPPGPAPPQPAVAYKAKPLPALPHYSLRSTQALLANPTTDQARQYLEERFGVPAPSKATLPTERSVHQGSGPGQLAKGRTMGAQPNIILPRQMREDGHGLPPPEVTDMELNRGLLHLVNRGLLPAKVDLSPALCGHNAPYKAGGAPLYPYHAQFSRAPPTSALEDALQARADYKLDLVTPVVRPQPELKSLALHIAQVGEAAGSGSPSAAATSLAQQRLAGTPTSRGGLGSPSQSLQPGETRPFDVLMDTFSLHEFMIRKGAAIRDTPEFESYQRTFEPIWPVLEGLLQHLEAICLQYAVPLAIVNGKSLADLAVQVAGSGYQPQMEDLLVCLSNIQEVAGVLKQPGRRFMGPGGLDAAATLIQAHVRGMMARRKYSKRGMASTAIQNAWRNSRLRTNLRGRLQVARAERDMRFAELHAQLATQWPLLQRNAHVVIHVPNLMPPPDVASGKGGVERRPEAHVLNTLLLREAAQLARLCDLSEPLLDLVLVLPSPPDQDVVHYWNKILEVGGVNDPTGRYRIIVPENHARLPSHMSVTAKLLASPRAMKRLHTAVQGRMAFIVPGNVHDDEVELSVQLGVPLLGPSPAVCRAFTRKSAARELFASIAANLAPGCVIRPRRGRPVASQGSTSCAGPAAGSSNTPPPADPLVSPLRAGTDYALNEEGDIIVREPQDMARAASPRTRFENDEQTTLMLLAEMMVRNPSITKWLFKIDDEAMGLGHAFFDTATVKGGPEILARAEALLAASASGRGADADLDQAALRLELGLGPASVPGGGAGGLPPLSDGQQVELFRLYELLFRQLPRRLHLACRESYPTYRDYMISFAARGGVIEACPHMAVGSPTVNLFLDPTGATVVLSTHERIFCYPFRAVGTTFPQSSVPHRALYDAAVAIGGAAAGAGLLGHVVVDFVTLAERDGSLKLWPVDIRPGLTPTLVTFQLFDFLTAGTFNPMTGTYTVELEPIEGDAASDVTSEPSGPAGEEAENGLSGAASHAHGHVVPILSMRHYFAIEQLTHPAVKATPCSKFFYHCWQNGFHFDVDVRQGVIFNLSDRYLTSGAVGMVCVALTPAATYSQMQQVLSFIASQEVEAGARTAWSLTTDMALYQDVQALVKYMAERSADQEQQQGGGGGSAALRASRAVK